MKAKIISLPERNKKEGKEQENIFICRINHDVNDAMNLQTKNAFLFLSRRMSWWIQRKTIQED